MGERLKLTGLAAAIVAPLALGVWTLAAGYREQVEVDVHTLRFRHVRSYALPGTGVQVSPAWTDDVESPLWTYLRDQGWVRDGDAHRWLGARRWSAGQAAGEGPAFALYEAFCERAGEWVAWSRSHPRAAAALWPRVVAAVHAGRPYDAGALLRGARERD